MSAYEGLRDFSTGEILAELKARMNYKPQHTNFGISSDWAILQDIKLDELKSGKWLTKDELLEELALRARLVHINNQTEREQCREAFREFDSETLYGVVAQRAATWRVEVLREIEDSGVFGDTKDFAVYGEDSRHDVSAVTSLPLARLLDATVLIEAASDLTPIEGGKFRLRTVTLNEWSESLKHKPLCAGTRFMNQPCSPDCSGVLIAPDIVLTAGHAVMRYTNNIQDRRFIFGFRMVDKDNARLEFPAEMVYSGKEIIAWRASEEPGPDWALVRLDRQVTGRQHVGSLLRRSGKVGDKQSLLVFGHPTGLPMKVAGGQVRDNSGDERIVTNLDTFGGNSGSPVITWEHREATIEGSLIGGEEDYVLVGNCFKVKQCSDDDCRGEDVQRINEVLPFIP